MEQDRSPGLPPQGRTVTCAGTGNTPGQVIHLGGAQGIRGRMLNLNSSPIPPIAGSTLTIYSLSCSEGPGRGRGGWALHGPVLDWLSLPDKSPHPHFLTGLLGPALQGAGGKVINTKMPLRRSSQALCSACGRGLFSQHYWICR